MQVVEYFCLNSKIAYLYMYELHFQTALHTPRNMRPKAEHATKIRIADWKLL